jgi:hypothetical protein
MISRSVFIRNFAVKLLSLLLAFSIWFMVKAEKEGETEFRAALLLSNVPRGLAVTGQVPHHIELRVEGPYLLLMKLREKPFTVTLDLKGLAEGSARFSDLGALVELPHGVRIVRTYPSAVELKLQKTRFP